MLVFTSNRTQEVLVWERVMAYVFLGKRPVACVSTHPPIFAAELQVPMGANPEEYGIWHQTMIYKLPSDFLCMQCACFN